MEKDLLLYKVYDSTSNLAFLFFLAVDLAWWSFWVFLLYLKIFLLSFGIFLFKRLRKNWVTGPPKSSIWLGSFKFVLKFWLPHMLIILHVGFLQIPIIKKYINYYNISYGYLIFIKEDFIEWLGIYVVSLTLLVVWAYLISIIRALLFVKNGF